VKVTLTPSTGCPPASTSFARSGSWYRVLTVALCSLPVAVLIAVAAAWLVRLNTAGVETPIVEALALKRPELPFATSGGEVASPSASVGAVACAAPPTKTPPAPVAPAAIAKVTLTLATGLPSASRTRACSGSAYWLLIVASCVAWPSAPIDAGSPVAVLVRSKRTWP
jgi:hypothetical protein